VIWLSYSIYIAIYRRVGAVVWPGFYLANLKNDVSTVSITNTGCIRCDNQCWVHIVRVDF
jgi:hypothetical protein